MTYRVLKHFIAIEKGRRDIRDCTYRFKWAKSDYKNHAEYFLSFIDHYSKLVNVYCTRTKDEVYDYLVPYVNELKKL